MERGRDARKLAELVGAARGTQFALSSAMAIAPWLRRHSWLPLLGLTALAAWLSAKVIANVVAANLATADVGAPFIQASEPAPTANEHATSAAPILARNPFDSRTGRLDGIDEGGGAVASTDPWSAPPCSGVKVDIISAANDPDASIAALSSVTDPPKSVLRRRGSAYEDKTVAFIGSDRVWLTRGAELCQVSLYRSAATPPPPPPPTVSPPHGLPPAIAKGIVRVGPNELTIDRAVVDAIFEQQAELMREVRVVPDGKSGGIRVVGVRPDSLLGTLGFESGDRLVTINGWDMTNPEQMLEAYARLRTAPHLRVAIERKGKSAAIDYEIR